MRLRAWTLAGAASAVCALGFNNAEAGEFSPYLPAPGGGAVNFTYVRQNGETLFRGSVESQRWERLTQDTYLISATYGLTDRIALDGRIGYAETDFQRRPGDPLLGQDGVSDFVLGFRYRLLDELEGAPVTVTLGASGIIQGLYTPTVVDGIGDGASGGQVGLAIGRLVTDNLTVSGEVGYRNRFSNVPGEVFISGDIGYTFNSRLSVFAGAIKADSLSGKDLGSAGFTSLQFPQLEEDVNLWNVGGQLRLFKTVTLNGSYGRKFEGKNTTNGPFFRVGLGYGF